jgi:hypothetical protein
MPIIWTYTKNKATYAEVCTSERKGKGSKPKSVPFYLSRVIDIKE